jgi:hypothetical protein
MNYQQAIELLSRAPAINVPINDHPPAESLACALRGVGDLVTSVELLAEMSSDMRATLPCGIHVEGPGGVRVVYHFTVAGREIVRLRQVDDTADVRAAGTPV